MQNPVVRENNSLQKLILCFLRFPFKEDSKEIHIYNQEVISEYLPSRVISLSFFLEKFPTFPSPTAKSSLLTLANSSVESWSL